MHSSELPVTEWWDPDEEVYDVPHTPRGAFWEYPYPQQEVDDWWAAYSHLWDLRWIMHGSAEYRPDFRGRELTTGHSELCDDVALFWERRECVPDCPRHRAPLAPCTCHYYRHGCGSVWLIGSNFVINRTCPHHGDRP